MRLGQIARKLNQDTKTLVAFLETEGVEILDSLNSKISDEHVTLLTRKFDTNVIEQESIDEKVIINNDEQPEVLESNTVESSLTEEVIEPETAEENKTSSASEPFTVSPEDTSNNSSDNNEESLAIPSDDDYIVNEIDGVIRAPKVHLDGIKVVGKIELPEKPTPPKSQEEPKEDKESTINTVEKSDGIHPNKKARIQASKSKSTPSSKNRTKKETSPEALISKEELKAKRKAEKKKKIARKQKEKKRLEKSGQLQEVVPKRNKKKKKTTEPVKKSFWERWFGW